ncbi:hypothetical protein ABPG72_002146 [Tetrahymena utriculariae]
MQNFEVNQIQILYNLPIGCGQFTKVYQAIDLSNEQIIACKEILINSNIPTTLIENELQVLANNQGDHIIKYYGCQQKNNKMCIFMEYSKYGDLAKYLEEFEYSLQIEEILKIFRQILEGYKILFENNVIHRDLKLENILIFGDSVKITDFGTAKYVHPFNSIEQSLQGTLGYFSPQLVFTNENEAYKYTYKTDIFSLGVLLFHMIYGRFPWKCQTFNYIQLQDEYEQVQQVGGIANYINFKPINQFVFLDKDIQECIISMLEFREEDRISFQDLYNHKIFQKLDYFNEKSKRQSFQFSGLATIDTSENENLQIQKGQIKLGSTVIENVSHILTESTITDKLESFNVGDRQTKKINLVCKYFHYNLKFCQMAWNILKLLDLINDHLLEQGLMQDKLDLLYFYLIKIKLIKLEELQNQIQFYDLLPQIIQKKIQVKKDYQNILNSPQMQEIKKLETCTYLGLESSISN